MEAVQVDRFQRDQLNHAWRELFNIVLINYFHLKSVFFYLNFQSDHFKNKNKDSFIFVKNNLQLSKMLVLKFHPTFRSKYKRQQKL